MTPSRLPPRSRRGCSRRAAAGAVKDVDLYTLTAPAGGSGAAGSTGDYTVHVGLAPAVAWVSQGPGVIRNGQTESLSAQSNPVAGSAQAVLPHPTDPDVLWAASANGGVWRTTNATNPNPTWVPLTDAQPGLSVGSLDRDPTDPTADTIVAGTGQTSSFGVNAPPVGLLRTTDGGATWTDVTPPGAGIGGSTANVKVGVHARAAGGTNAVYVAGGRGGRHVGGAGRAGDGRRRGDAISQATNATPILITTPSHVLPTGMFVRIYGATGNTAANGYWRVTAIDSNTFSLDASAGNGAYTSGGLWTRAEGAQPTRDGPDVGPPGDFPPEQDPPPGGQGHIHFSLAADPTDPNLVYIGGDRQPAPFPNSIGARNYTGRLFRGDASLPAGNVWSPLTHSGTNNNSAPHADSRDLAFDAAGNLIEEDDGGVYRRTNPASAAGGWAGVIGNYVATEGHSAAFDPVTKLFLTGTQDTGTAVQTAPGSPTWNQVYQGDGAVTAVTVDGANSVRYYSYQYQQQWRRQTRNASNTVVSSALLAARVPALGAGATLFNMPGDSVQFYSPYTVHPADPARLLFGANRSVDGTDFGDFGSPFGLSSSNPAFLG